MSDEGGKPEDDPALLKTSGRVRICKHCRFTTTDVREFSKHRLTAHTEELDEKNTTRRNSLRGNRRASRSSTSLDETEMNSVGDHTSTSRDLVLKIKLNSDTNEAIVKQNNSSEQSTEDETKPEAQAAGESVVKPAKEFLDCLNLGAKVSRMSSGGSSSDVVTSENKRPATEKLIMENGNGLSEEVLLVNKDDDPEDEGRLVIADDGGELSDSHNTSLPNSNQTLLKRSGNIQNRTYICNVCEFSTTSAKIYLHHQKDLHCQDILIYECDICEYATKYKQKLPRHRKLHFSGKESNLASGSDLDNSMSERDLKEMKEMNELKSDGLNGDFDVDDDYVDDDEEEEEVLPTVAAEVNNVVIPEIVEKKKRIRQEVDPAKYFEVFDDVGIKYACSKCGNVYKWRKSLNKHWKEKHFGETPNLSNPPPTLQNYTLYSRFKNKFGTQSPSPTSVSAIYNPSPSSMARPISASPSAKPEEVTSPVVMPKFIGPFIGGTTTAVYNSGSPSPVPNIRKKEQKLMELHDRRTPSEERQGTPKSHTSSSSGSQRFPGNSQMEPLDFSVKKDAVKIEPWEEDMDDSSFSEASGIADPQVIMNQDPDDPNKQYPVLQCSKCSFVAKTLVDYSAHMTLHLNRRAFKCAECQEHFSGVEDLNKHFAELHAEKIQEHKEAIQKIPHGLQQTYHLLKMPLDVISNLSSQELLSNEPKQLKCSMCSFVAKWPAELQKHAVSHSEERPFICMVCGSTYKWKWDLVKHFEKSHHTLPNPYKRREQPGITVKSPSPQVPTISKTAVALLDASMTRGDYLVNDESAPPKKKRRLSDTDMPADSDGFYLMDTDSYDEELMADKFEMPKRPSSLPSRGTEDSEYDVMALEYSGKRKADFLDKMNIDAGKFDSPVSVADALKQHLASNRSQIEELAMLNKKNVNSGNDVSDGLLPYKCSICEYRARWPSEISQHMKNHSNEKPFHCPRCSYKSKWKWDVVKHLRRCGGGTVHDVIDTSKFKKMAPPNVMVMPEGSFQKQTPHNLSSSSSLVQQNSSSSSAQSHNRVSTPNFSVAIGGQDHPNSGEFSSMSPSSTSSASPVNTGRQAVFRSLINQGMYHCLECPFIGNSPAELRRHAVLHSENKPFTCEVCGYSSRWKCDLKKHIRTYGHYTASQMDSDGMETETSQDRIEIEDGESDEEQRSTLYMCPKCPYNTYKKQAYNNHLQIHCDANTENSAPTSSPAKFKCSKCDYQGNDLSSFLQHKVSHSAQSSSGPSPSPAPSVGESSHSSDVSNRTLHLKHRRKPVKQFYCPKCPYICFKQTSLTRHQSMHEPRGPDSFLCLYCDYNVFTKGLLLQHMQLHRESSEDSSMVESDLQQIEEMEEKDMATVDSMKVSQLEENNNVEYEMDTSGGVLDFSRSSTPFGETRQPTSVHSTQPRKGVFGGPASDGKTKAAGLPCEWCSATFPNVSTLYQHAQSLHPSLLKAQESGDAQAKQTPAAVSAPTVKKSIPQEMLNHFTLSATNLSQLQAAQRKYVPLAPRPPQASQAPPPAHGLSSNNFAGNNSSGANVVQALSHSQTQIQQMQQAQQAQQAQAAYQLNAARARKTISPARRSRSFQCTKCSFTAPNAVTYLRHIERHGSNCKHTCRFCDYSIDRLNLLYQHMKGTHSDQWKGTAEEKINLSVGGEDSNNNLISAPRESPTDSFNISDNSEDLNGSFGGGNESHDGELNFNTSDGSIDGGVLPMMNSKGIRPVLVIREETTWRGIAVQVCSLDGKKHYKCPKCYYISSNAANTTNHVRQHGSNRKYQCNQCDYSVDNLKLIQHHMESVHPKEPNFIQFGGAGSYSMASTSTVQPSEEPEPEMNNNEAANLSMKSPSMVAKYLDMNMKGTSETPSSSLKSSPVYQCPKCPFIVRNKQVLQIHLERHEYPGKYECQLCDYSVDVYDLLRKHAKLHYRKVRGSAAAMLDDDEELTYEEVALMEAQAHSKAEVPDEKADNMETFIAKAKQGGGRLRYRCSRCPFFAFSRSSFMKHRKQHTVKNKLTCQLCSYSTGKNYLFQQHMRIHEDGEKLAMEDPNQFHDLVLDPYDEKNFKLLSQISVPPDEDSEEVIEDFEDEEEEEFGEGMEEFYDEMGDMEEADEDDIEAAMMEEELQGHITADEFKADKKQVNSEANFDTELQFRNYKCTGCPYSSNSASEFRKHFRLHGANLKFQCDYCTYSLDRVNLLSQHRKLHFQEPNFDPSPPTSKLVNKNHEDYDPNKIQQIANEELSKTENSAADVRYVYQKSFSKSPASILDDKVRYTCNLCPYRCNALKSFKCHIQMHGLNRKYKCDYCNWSADRLNLLYQHRKVHMLEPGFNPTPGDIVFLNRSFALEGEKMMMEKTGLGSGYVGMALTDNPGSPFVSEELQGYQSIDGKVGPKKYYCKICPFKTESANEYTYHKKMHCMEARYDCPSCSYTAYSWQSLNDHMKSHKKETTTTILMDNKTIHKCTKCPYSSQNKNLLAVHVTMHAAGRKYTCRYCDYSIDRYNLLRQHMKIHLDVGEGDESPGNEDAESTLKKTPDVIGPQIYFSPVKGLDLNDSDSNDTNTEEHNCDRCPFSTNSKDDLVCHEVKHNVQDKHSCMYCTYNCNNEEELVKHTQLHFPSAAIDKDTLKILKDKQGSSHRRNISKSLTSDKGNKKTSEEETGEPDSTVSETSKSDSTEKAVENSIKKGEEKKKESSVPVKCYVCQYCDREFDTKVQMKQHEKQHLVGY